MTREAHSVLDRRRAGVLLHITSLPGGQGNGDLGRDARRFVDLMVGCGITVWQTLPINPTHDDGSPYQCLSAHAGNPNLISLEWLVEKGLLERGQFDKQGAHDGLDRGRLLGKAFETFIQTRRHPLTPAFGDFIRKNSGWLADYALFIALREEFDRRPWQSWPEAYRQREPLALAAARSKLATSITRVNFEQFLFFSQWYELREYANRRGLLLFGDIPIFVAGDSSDVWARQDQFDLDSAGHARVVAGVPPDYFSETGQRWGNPHYRWDRMAQDGFTWWLERFRGQLELYDWVRIDHFRGFEAYWEIPAESATAMEGHWVKAPGHALLEKLFESVGQGGLPLIAENLGIITPEVEALREAFNIPGMLILQFAFDGGPDNPYLPANHTPNNVVYTGTHDNDTTLSWFEGLTSEQRQQVFAVLGTAEKAMPEALIDCALQSTARLAMLPMQDLLGLGRGNRMNTPGTTKGNWCWRFSWDQVSEEALSALTDGVRLYGRSPG